jgi:hypothetical protein
MIKYLVFDINDVNGWDSTDLSVLTKMKESDVFIVADRYSDKILSANGLQCAMPFEMANAVALSGLTEEQVASLVEIQPNDPNWIVN